MQSTYVRTVRNTWCIFYIAFSPSVSVFVVLGDLLLIYIVVFAFRQCAAWASTLINHNIPRRKLYLRICKVVVSSGYCTFISSFKNIKVVQSRLGLHYWCNVVKYSQVWLIALWILVTLIYVDGAIWVSATRYTLLSRGKWNNNNHNKSITTVVTVLIYTNIRRMKSFPHYDIACFNR